MQAQVGDGQVVLGRSGGVSQAFVVFIPVKSVGVVGDARRYEYVVSLRAVKTIDFMTASFAHLQASSHSNLI